MAAGWPAEVTHRQCVISPEPNIPHFNVIDNHIFYHYSLWPLQFHPACHPPLLLVLDWWTQTLNSLSQGYRLRHCGLTAEVGTSCRRSFFSVAFPTSTFVASLFYGPGCLKLRQNRIQRGSLFNGYGCKHNWCPSILFYLYSPILQIETICRLPLHTDCITNKRHKIAHKFWFNFWF